MINLSIPKQISTPCYVLEERALNKNLDILESIQNKSGAKILLALKGYAFWRVFDKVREILYGSTASGLYEAKLGFESIGGREKGKEICVFSPAYKKEEIIELSKIATHIIFNSFHQWEQFAKLIHTLNPKISLGLRINPLYSEVTPPIYNPCVKGSRLGITPSEFQKNIAKYGIDSIFGDTDGKISGLHFHTHCEQNSDALCRTLPHVKKHFEAYFKYLKWINFGGGHHITRQDYDTNLFIQTIIDFKHYYNLEVFLEPGEAVGWEVGYLLGSVIDIVHNGMDIAILDVSASNHMPDCLEMPYRPKVAIFKNDKLHFDLGDTPTPSTHTYKLGGPTCLAGDVLGDFSFDVEIQRDDKIVFFDMIHYTIVKNTMFNGIPLPSLCVVRENGEFETLKTYGYNDYKERN